MTPLENDRIWVLLLDTLIYTFETMAFAETSPCCNQWVHKSNYESIWAKVQVNSDSVEEFLLIIPCEFASDLYQVMYAESPAIEPNSEKPETMQPLFDMSAELANVIIGKFLQSMQNARMTFTLTVPETGLGTPTIPNDATICRCVVEDTLPITAVVKLHKSCETESTDTMPITTENGEDETSPFDSASTPISLQD